MSIRVTVIGSGFGKSTVAPAYAEHGCDVTVVSPRDTGAITSAIETPCDLVSVHSPPFMHREHVAAAARAGRAILCDKPFGRSLAEARAMAELADNAGVLHFLNFEFRRDPLRIKLKELLDAGAIGEPTHVNWTMFYASPANRQYGWLFDRERGGGWIGAFGSHVVDAMRWLFGDAIEARAVRRVQIKDRPGGDGMSHRCTAEDAFSAQLTMSSGLTLNLDTASSSSIYIPEEIIVFGREGILLARAGVELSLLRAGKDPIQMHFREGETDLHKPGIGIWLGEVCAAVRDGKQISPNFADGVACAAVLEKLRAD